MGAVGSEASEIGGADGRPNRNEVGAAAVIGKMMMAKASRRLLKERTQKPKKVESRSSANRSNNGPEQSESREQIEREQVQR